ncbi:MAG TPA: ABC transporter substrate-binding protein [Acidimicrobiia bacterium]|nr:ABC transporter substrate-binding protein [Acidimicrobiia bacterium]
MKKSMPSGLSLFVLAVMAVAIVVACSSREAAVRKVVRTSTTEGHDGDATFRVGLVGHITTDNWWAVLDAEDTSPNRAYLTNSKTSLFTLTLPGFVHVPAAAATEVPVAPVQIGDHWVAEQPMRRDIVWSDGTPLTANDLAFYFETVRQLHLGSAHADVFDPTVLSVTAPDDYTVRIEFSERPTLAVWNNGIALAKIPPAHFWRERVAAVRESGGGRLELYSASGLGEPSAGPMIVDGWVKGSFATTVPNPEYIDSNTERIILSDGSVRFANADRDEDRVFRGDGSGEVFAHFLEGPFVSRVVWVEHDTREEAYESLVNGEVDYVLDPHGMSPVLRREIVTSSDLNISTSPAEGFRYLAFNMRKAPMSDLAFRRAIATVIDKELIADSVLGGAVEPGYTVVHPGLVAHYNPEIVRAGWADGEPMSEGERFETAIETLRDAGYTWATEPVLKYYPDGTLSEVTPGEGLTMPNAEPVPKLTLLAPGPEYDPFRATYAVWIGQWMRDLGIPLVTELTDDDVIVASVFPPQDSVSILDWDMYIFGWGRSDPSLPGTALRAFFHSDQDTAQFGGLNTAGYSSPEFDAAANAFQSATTIQQAAERTREMEAIVARDLPYIVLFRPRIFEAYHSYVRFPVESMMAGHAGFTNGWPGSVRVEKP